MASYKFERLSAQDNSFLFAETPNAPLHVAAVGIYDNGDLAQGTRGINFRKIKHALEAQLHRIPRYRQKLMWTPLENKAVWVDDPSFNMDYHLRHAALPHPGGLDQLKKLAARITTRQLDRTRPLWEMWVIEGLSGNRFAMVSKIHHCMIDGASGADVAQILMSATPEHEIEEPKPFLPRPAPTPRELLVDAGLRQAALPFRLVQGLAALPDSPAELATQVSERVGALAGLAKWGLSSSSQTPINGDLGPHRRIDWLTLPLPEVKAVRKELGCTVNDVVLATVSGAVRQYFIQRGVDPDGLDFRISAPVSVRRDSEKGKLGNRVSTWIVQLPLDEADPAKCVAKIKAATAELKESRQAQAFDLLMGAAEYLPGSFVSLAARAAEGPINMIVTNVQGPPFPLYLLGAELLELHPLVPLMNGLGLGVALFSYDGKLHVGLNADYELIPDLSVFTVFLAQAFMLVVDAAGIGSALESTGRSAKPPAAKPAKRKARSGKKAAAGLRAVARASPD